VYMCKSVLEAKANYIIETKQLAVNWRVSQSHNHSTCIRPALPVCHRATTTRPVSDLLCLCVTEPQPLDLYQTCSAWVHSGSSACQLSAWWTSGLWVVSYYVR